MNTISPAPASEAPRVWTGPVSPVVINQTRVKGGCGFLADPEWVAGGFGSDMLDQHPLYFPLKEIIVPGYVDVLLPEALLKKVYPQDPSKMDGLDFPAQFYTGDPRDFTILVPWRFNEQQEEAWRLFSEETRNIDGSWNHAVYGHSLAWGYSDGKPTPVDIETFETDDPELLKMMKRVSREERDNILPHEKRMGSAPYMYELYMSVLKSHHNQEGVLYTPHGKEGR